MVLPRWQSLERFSVDAVDVRPLLLAGREAASSSSGGGRASGRPAGVAEDTLACMVCKKPCGPGEAVLALVCMHTFCPMCFEAFLRRRWLELAAQLVATSEKEQIPCPTCGVSLLRYDVHTLTAEEMSRLCARARAAQLGAEAFGTHGGSCAAPMAPGAAAFGIVAAAFGGPPGQPSPAVHLPRRIGSPVPTRSGGDGGVPSLAGTPSAHTWMSAPEAGAADSPTYEALSQRGDVSIQGAAGGQEEVDFPLLASVRTSRSGSSATVAALSHGVAADYSAAPPAYPEEVAVPWSIAAPGSPLHLLGTGGAAEALFAMTPPHQPPPSHQPQLWISPGSADESAGHSPPAREGPCTPLAAEAARAPSFVVESPPSSAPHPSPGDSGKDVPRLTSLSQRRSLGRAAAAAAAASGEAEGPAHLDFSELPCISPGPGSAASVGALVSPVWRGLDTLESPAGQAGLGPVGHDAADQAQQLLNELSDAISRAEGRRRPSAEAADALAAAEAASAGAGPLPERREGEGLAAMARALDQALKQTSAPPRAAEPPPPQPAPASPPQVARLRLPSSPRVSLVVSRAGSSQLPPAAAYPQLSASSVTAPSPLMPTVVVGEPDFQQAIPTVVVASSAAANLTASVGSAYSGGGRPMYATGASASGVAAATGGGASASVVAAYSGGSSVSGIAVGGASASASAAAPSGVGSPSPITAPGTTTSVATGVVAQPQVPRLGFSACSHMGLAQPGHSQASRADGSPFATGMPQQWPARQQGLRSDGSPLAAGMGRHWQQPSQYLLQPTPGQVGAMSRPVMQSGYGGSLAAAAMGQTAASAATVAGSAGGMIGRMASGPLVVPPTALQPGSPVVRAGVLAAAAAQIRAAVSAGSPSRAGAVSLRQLSPQSPVSSRARQTPLPASPGSSRAASLAPGQRGASTSGVPTAPSPMAPGLAAKAPPAGAASQVAAGGSTTWAASATGARLSMMAQPLLQPSSIGLPVSARQRAAAAASTLPMPCSARAL